MSMAVGAGLACWFRNHWWLTNVVRGGCAAALHTAATSLLPRALSCPSHPARCCPALPSLQGDLIARLQELVKTKSDRRIVYQQKEGGSGSGAPVAEAAAEAST